MWRRRPKPVSRVSRADVESCYRLLLNRVPLESEIDQWCSVAAAEDVTPSQLAERFIASDEFRKRPVALRTLDLNGLTFSVAARDQVYDRSEYEPYVFRPLMERMLPGTTFVDIGANIGVFSLHAAKRGAEVMAIEAAPRNAALFLHNLTHLALSVEFHPLGASDHDGYSMLMTQDGSSNAFVSEGGFTLGLTVIPTARLDRLVGERHVDVIKIDVEGHEYRAMLGTLETLKRCRPVIFTEFSPVLLQSISGVSPHEYLNLLLQFGYSVTILHRSKAPERLAPEGLLTRIDRAQEEEVAAGGTHLDLQLEPIR